MWRYLEGNAARAHPPSSRFRSPVFPSVRKSCVCFSEVDMSQ